MQMARFHTWRRAWLFVLVQVYRIASGGSVTVQFRHRCALGRNYDVDDVLQQAKKLTWDQLK